MVAVLTLSCGGGSSPGNGTSGSAGAAGAGAAGSAGTSGASGESGSAGSAGASGAGGTAGSGPMDGGDARDASLPLDDSGTLPEDGGRPIAPLLTAPCPATETTDEYVDGVNSRTGCTLILKPLGSVVAAEDLVLPVVLVRNEGIAPPAILYDGKNPYGRGEWLSTDEFVVRATQAVDGFDGWILHTPTGVVRYDSPLRGPGVGTVASGVAYRSRPFDQTYLVATSDPNRGGPKVTISRGSFLDSRNVRKVFTPVGTDPATAPYLFTSITKKSIYEGADNTIGVTRVGKITTGYTSTRYARLQKVPLRLEFVPDVGAPSRLFAKSTLFNGVETEARIEFNSAGNVSSLWTPGRNGTLSVQTKLAYAGDTVATRTVESEGRVMSNHRFERRASGAKPASIAHVYDETTPGATNVASVKLCPDEATGTYFTFNRPAGGSVAHRYEDVSGRPFLASTVDERDIHTSFSRNPSQGAATGYPGATGFEMTSITTSSNGGTSQLGFFYDKYRIITNNLPFVGRVRVAATSGMPGAGGPIAYQAKYFDSNLGSAIDVPGLTMGDDGVSSAVDADRDGFVKSRRVGASRTTYTLEGATGNLPYATEVLVAVADGVRTKTTRNRYGELVSSCLMFDRTLDSAGKACTTIEYAADEYPSRVTYPNGDFFQIDPTNGWNRTGTAVRKGTLSSRTGVVLQRIDLAENDDGEVEGTGTVTFGTSSIEVGATRREGGLLSGLVQRGPDQRVRLDEAIDHGATGTTPRGVTINAFSNAVATPVGATATEECK